MPDPSQPEARRTDRVRTLLGGVIRFNNGLSSVPCYVRDLTDFGAKLAITGDALLPDAFDLEIPKRGVTLAAQAKWRSKDVIGVEFVQQEAPAVDLATRVKQLEAENTVLRKRIADMARRLDSYGDSESFAV